LYAFNLGVETALLLDDSGYQNWVHVVKVRILDNACTHGLPVLIAEFLVNSHLEGGFLNTGFYEFVYFLHLCNGEGVIGKVVQVGGLQRP